MSAAAAAEMHTADMLPPAGPPQQAAEAGHGASPAASHTEASPAPQRSGFIDRFRRRPITEAIPPSVPNHEAATKGRFITGESHTSRVEIPQEVLNDVANRISDRMKYITSASVREDSLTRIDRALKSRPELADKLRTGEITDENLSLVWSALVAETFEKGAARQSLVTSDKGSSLKTVPIIGRFTGEPHSTLIDANNPDPHDAHIIPGTTIPPAPGATPALDRLTSSFTEFTKYASQNRADVEHDLITLDQTRLAIEMRLFNRGVRSNLFDAASTGIFPTEFFEQTQNDLHSNIVREIDGPNGLIAQTGHATFRELWENDPTTALQVLHEATQRAWSSFSADAARALLTSEKPKITATDLESKANELNPAPTGPVKESDEIVKKNDELTRLTGAETTETTRLTNLRERLVEAERELPLAERAFSEAEHLYSELEPGLTAEQNRLDAVITAHIHARDSIATLTPPAGITPEQHLAFVTAEQARISKEKADYNRLIEKAEAELKVVRDKKDHLIETKASAEGKKLHYQKEINELQDNTTTTPPTKGLIGKQEGRLIDARDAVLKATKELADLRTAAGKETTDGKITAKAIEAVAASVSNYQAIVSARFEQGDEGEYSIERISDLTIQGDKVAGAEKIIEQIAALSNPTKIPDQDLYRSVYGYENIARSIIWAYKLDANALTNPDGISARQIMADIALEKNNLANTPDRHTLVRKAMEDNIRTLEIELISLTLPYLRSDQFSVADAMRFLISKTSESANLGRPFATIDDRYLETESGLR